MRCNLSVASVNVTPWIEIALSWITMIEPLVRQFNGGSADVVLRYSGGVLTPLLARRGLPSRAEKTKAQSSEEPAERVTILASNRNIVGWVAILMSVWYR